MDDPRAMERDEPLAALPERPGRAAYEAYAAAMPHLNCRPWDEITAELQAAMKAAARAAYPSLRDAFVAASVERDEARAAAWDMLSRFIPTSDGHRARVGQVQIARWRDQLEGKSAADCPADCGAGIHDEHCRAASG